MRIQKLKFEGQSVEKIEWKQTDGQKDGRTDTTNYCFNFPANAVSKNIVRLLASSVADAWVR